MENYEEKKQIPADIYNKRIMTTAILVDGGFYRKRAKLLAGEKRPAERVKELFEYCLYHLEDKNDKRYLYRIFYYDCPPSKKNIYNPITKNTINLGESELFTWTNEFFNELKTKRKVALRLGSLSENQLNYNIKPEVFKKLLRGTIKLEDLTLNDCKLNIEQKGVDMRIGIDISSLAFKKQVNQIILIAGDSDFVPASKQARREGIDFILDPMGNHIKDDLFEHIDGIEDKSHKLKNKIHKTIKIPCL